MLFSGRGKFPEKGMCFLPNLELLFFEHDKMIAKKILAKINF
jgi:hypothetical protein